MALQHLRSSTASKRPDPAAMADGQLAINTAATSTGLFYKNASGALVKAGPVHIGATAPNATPASGGHAGHSLGESWLDTAGSNPVLKIWDGSAWQIAQPVASGSVVSTADTGSVTSTMIADGTIVNADVNSAAAIAGTKVSPSFGDQDIVTTGNLTLNAQGDLRFGDSDSSNWVAFQAPATVSSNVTWTLPAADGTTGQVLSTNGSGTLSWATAGGGATDKIEEGNTSAEVIDTGSDGRFVVTTEGSERLRVGPDGQIGLSGTNYGTSGQVLTSNGTAAAPTWQAVSGGSKIEQGNTSAEVTDTGSNGTFVVTTDGSERARVDSSGRLLVGTSTARASANGVSAGLQVEGTGAESALSIIRNGGLAYLTLGRSGGGSVGSNTAISNNDELGRISWAAADGTDIQSWAAQISAEIDGTPGSNDTPGRLVFSTTADGASSPTERMRIQNNGLVLIGRTAAATSPAYLGVQTTSANPALCLDADSTSGRTQVRFNNPNGNVGFISTDGSATTYSTSSDYRLKENVVLLTGAIDRLQQIPVHRFNFIADPDKTVDGFLAHEAQEIVPECVTGEKDAVDDEGNPIYQGIDQSKLVPLLTAALQEAIGRIETLEAEVTALKAQ